MTRGGAGLRTSTITGPRSPDASLRRATSMVAAAALAFSFAGASPAAGNPTTADGSAPSGEHRGVSATASSLAGFSLAASEVSRRVLVRWHDEVTSAERGAVLARARRSGILASATADRVTDRVDAVRVVGPAPDAVDHLESFAEVAIAEPDRVVTRGVPDATVAASAFRGAASPTPADRPTDVLYPQQWALENTGQALQVEPGSAISGEAGVDIRAREAWARTRGSAEVVVAVIDTAVDEGHPDLDGALVDQVETIEDTAPNTVHGTSVASVIAARSDDGYGISGTAPRTSILSIAAFTTTDRAPTSSMANILMAFEVAKEADVDVINASWVTPEDSELLRSVVASAGVPVVAATGNDSRVLSEGDAAYPAGWDLPNLVSVTSIDPDGELSPFANSGATIVDIAAPGSSILVATPPGAPDTAHSHAYANGTSFAVPFVSGALALAIAAAPDATPSELIDAVSWTSRFRANLTQATISSGHLDAGALVHGVQRPVCRSDARRAAGFADVSPTNVHAAAIDCVSTAEVASGRSDTRFDPDAEVTRGQVASFLHRVLERGWAGDVGDAEDAGDVGAEGIAFDDVPAGSAHHDAVVALAALGIAHGDGTGSFRPHDPVTRAHLSAFVVRTHDVVTGGGPPASRRWFEDTGHSIHVNEIDRARDLGLVRGVSTRAFAPGALTRRDQTASLLARMLDSLARDAAAAS